MKKSKLLAPLVGLGAIAAVITPIATLTSCNNNKLNQSTEKVLPAEAFIIDADGILRGFNPKFKITENYDTMSFNDNISPIITGVGVAAFYNPVTAETTIPANIKYLKFADTYSNNNIIEGPTETIGDYAFYGSPFKRVRLPYGIKTIGRFAFSHSQVESCNFPGGLDEIKEEAFSYSNLCSAMFANDVDNFDNLTSPAISLNAPWMREVMEAISARNCVKHVRPKAFYNCKNLVAHRITPYVGAYELDEDGNGPFAIYDEAQRKVVGSNIKILDYSCFIQNFNAEGNCDVPKNPQAIFGIQMNREHSQTISTDKFIICHDLYGLENKWPEQVQLLNMIATSFGCTELYQQSITQMPLTMGEWTILSQSKANYGIVNQNLTTTIDLGSISYNNPVTVPLQYFFPQSTQVTMPFFFPGDTQVDINNVSSDGLENISSHVHAKVFYDTSSQFNVLQISLDKPRSELGITTIEIDLTFWSKYGFSYTYGPQYKWDYSNEIYVLDNDVENNHIHVSVTD